MFKRANVDITGGPLLKSIITYAFPIMIGGLIQVLFNAADLMVVGNMGSEADVAAVGATSPMINLFVNSCIGLSAGVSAVLARCLGHRDEGRAKRIVTTSVFTALFLGVILTAALVLTCTPFLRMTDCPEDCFAGAADYIKVYAIGVPAVLVYNFGASIIRTSGDTQRPFNYLVVAGVLNVVLNFALCLVLTKKVIAVALSTTVSQFVAAVLTVWHLLRDKGICGINIKEIRFSAKELVGILKIGAPCAFNSALFSLSNVQMQTALNSYGTAAIAGNSAAMSLESSIGSLSSGFNSATVPFVGQNVGAGNKKRVGKSILICSSVSAAIGLVGGVGLTLMAEPILGLYLPGNAEAVQFGIARMRHVIMFYAIAAFYGTLVSAMQAFGYSFIPMINSIITVLGFRVLWLEWIYPILDASNRHINNLFVCYTISWTLSLIAHTTMFIIVYSKYKKGKVRQI